MPPPLPARCRIVLEAGTKAFLSYVRAYKEHHCRFIFRLQVRGSGQWVCDAEKLCCTIPTDAHVAGMQQAMQFHKPAMLRLLRLLCLLCLLCRTWRLAPWQPPLPCCACRGCLRSSTAGGGCLASPLQKSTLTQVSQPVSSSAAPPTLDTWLACPRRQKRWDVPCLLECTHAGLAPACGN